VEARTVDQFSDYLEWLARDAAMGMWRNGTVPEFLSGIRNSLATATVSEPLSWQWLASILRDSRGHEYVSPRRREADPLDLMEFVEDLPDLLLYLDWLGDDFANDQRSPDGRWGHYRLDHWLNAWASWLRSWPGRSQLDPVTWRSVAIQLAAARVYE
jgi:hypothetical protein